MKKLRLTSSWLDPRVPVCPSSLVKFKVKKNGKDGLKTMLTGLITKQLRLMLDLHTTLPCCHLTSLVLMALVRQSLLETFVARKNGKDGLKITLTGSTKEVTLLNPDLLTTPLFFKLKVLSTLQDLMVLACLPFPVSFKVKNNGKDGLKTTLTGSTLELRLLKQDFLTFLLLFNLLTKEN